MIRLYFFQKSVDNFEIVQKTRSILTVQFLATTFVICDYSFEIEAIDIGEVKLPEHSKFKAGHFGYKLVVKFN